MAASAPDMYCWHCMLFQLGRTGPHHNQLNLAERSLAKTSKYSFHKPVAPRSRIHEGGSVKHMSASSPPSTFSTSASTLASPHSTRCSPQIHRSPGLLIGSAGGSGASSGSASRSRSTTSSLSSSSCAKPVSARSSRRPADRRVQAAAIPRSSDSNPSIDCLRSHKLGTAPRSSRARRWSELL